LSDTSPRARPAELIFGALMLVAALALTGTVVKLRLDTRPATPSGAEQPLSGTVLVPSAGEGVSFFPGAGHVLFVDSEPPARVSVDGQEKGETPWSADVKCEADLALKLERTGYKPQELKVSCRMGTTRVSVSLKRR
jgi:hypothetical protein